MTPEAAVIRHDRATLAMISRSVIRNDWPCRPDHRDSPSPAVPLAVPL